MPGKKFNPFGIEVGKIPDSPESKAFWRSAVPKPLPIKANPDFAKSKVGYRKAIEAATLGALVIVILAFQAMKNFGLEARESKAVAIKVEVMDIPVTQQLHIPPPPPRPVVPVPTEDESVPEDVTIASTDLNLSELPPPPPPPETLQESAYAFVAYDSPPTPVGGWKEIYKYVVYPELAIRAGVEGVVFVKALVNEKGEVEDARIMKSSGSQIGFEEAALAATRKIKWQPALQRDRPIKVWVGFPIKFKLTSSMRS
jgi:protein TonB